MSERSLVDSIAEARKRHGLSVAAFSRPFAHPVARSAEERLGVSAHGGGGASATWSLAAAATRARYWQLQNRGQSVLGLCILAALDGYAVAQALAPAARSVKVIKSHAALTRFANGSVSSGPALLTGPLADVAKSLVNEYAEAERPALQPLVRELTANALAAGVLLYVHERGAEHPSFEGLVTKAPARLPKAPVAPSNVADDPKLIQAVLASPDDDAPRRVLADWLLEHNDPRGTLIQLQCSDPSPENEALSKALLSKHQQTWVAPFREFIRSWTFARGFVHSVVGDFETFVGHVDAFEAQPLINAKLTAYRPRMLKLAQQAKPHPTLAAVDLSGNRLEPKRLELISAPFFSRVRSLDLTSNHLAEDNLEALTKHLPTSVTRVDLSYCRISTSALEHFSRSPAFARLTHLGLRANPALEGNAVRFLERATNLEYLALTPQQIGAAGLYELATLTMPKLERLSLQGADGGGMNGFVDRSGLASLRTIDLPSRLAPDLLNALEARYPPREWPNVFML